MHFGFYYLWYSSVDLIYIMMRTGFVKQPRRYFWNTNIFIFNNQYYLKVQTPLLNEIFVKKGGFLLSYQNFQKVHTKHYCFFKNSNKKIQALRAPKKISWTRGGFYFRGWGFVLSNSTDVLTFKTIFWTFSFFPENIYLLRCFKMLIFLENSIFLRIFRFWNVWRKQKNVWQKLISIEKIFLGEYSTENVLSTPSFFEKIVSHFRLV